MTNEQAYNNLSSVVLQALGAGMFKTFEDAGIAQQSILTIKKLIEDEKKNDKKESSS